MAEEHILTQRAKDVLFFAKYYSSPDKPRPVEPEHILLALVQIDPKLFKLLLATESDEVITALKEDLKSFDPTTHQSWLAAEPPPLSSAAQQVVRLASEEIKRLGDVPIGTGHLLLGLIESHSSGSAGDSSRLPVSEILRRRGFSLERVGAHLKAGSLTPQFDYVDPSSVLRPLPDSRKPRFRSFFRFIRATLDRFRILFPIVLIQSLPGM